jgi:hypothetical protein
MNSTTKLYSIVLFLSTIVIFGLWTILYPLKEINDIYKIIITSVFSVGTFRIFIKLIILLTKKWKWLKKIVLGNLYFEGTWAGFYIGYLGKERFIIERYEQDIDKLTVIGKSLNEVKQYHSSWNSLSFYCDIIKRKISYSYESTGIGDRVYNQGIANFYIERDNQYSAAKTLIGFYQDLHFDKRTECKMIKASDSCSYSEEEALKIAMQLFKENSLNDQ